MDALPKILAKGFKQGPSGSGDPESTKNGFGVFAELVTNAQYCTTYAVYSMPLPHNGFIMAPYVEFRAPKGVVKEYKRQRFIQKNHIDQIQITRVWFHAMPFSSLYDSQMTRTDADNWTRVHYSAYERFYSIRSYMMESSRFLLRAKVTDETRQTLAGRVFSELVSSGLVGNLRPRIIQSLAHKVSLNSSEAGIKVGYLSDSHPGTPGRTDEMTLVPVPKIGSKQVEKRNLHHDDHVTTVVPKLQAVPQPAREFCNQPCSVWHYRESMFGTKYYCSCGRFCKKYDRNHSSADCSCYSNQVPKFEETDWETGRDGKKIIPPPGTTFKGGAKADPTPSQFYKKTRKS